MAARAATKSAPKTTTKTTTKATSKPAAAKTARTTLTPDPVPAATTATTATTTTTAGSTLGFMDVPTVEKAPWGILGLVLNIFFPGVGTIVAGAKVGATNQIIKGVVQMLTVVVLLLGWVWAIVDGVRIFKRAT